MTRLLSLLALILFFSDAYSQHSIKGEPYQLDTSQINDMHYFFEGKRAKDKDEIIKAFQYFQKCVDRNPKNDATYFELAQIAFVQGDGKLTLEFVEKAYNLKPKNTSYRDLYLHSLKANGDVDKALAIYEKEYKSPNCTDKFKLEYARALIKADKPEKALKIYDNFLKDDGFNEMISIEKINLYVDIEKYDKAEEEMKKVIKNNPNNTEYLANLAEFYISSNRNTEAEKVYNDILRIEPNNITALLFKAMKSSKNNDREEYKKISRNIINHKEIDLLTKLTFLSQSLNDEKKQNDSLAFLKELSHATAKQYPNDYKSHQFLGDIYYISGDRKNAITHYEKAIKIEKNEFAMWQNLFFSYSSIKDYIGLEKVTKEALDYYPATATVYYYNCLANFELKNINEAEKAFTRGLRFVGDNKEVEESFYSLMGDMYFKNKMYKKSDEHFDEALEINRNNAFTLNNYAYYLSLRKDKLEKAKKMSKRSIELEPKVASFYDTYAWICFQMGNFVEAKSYQEKAIENEKSDMSTIYDHYGDILFHINQKDKAVEYWKKAKEAGSNNKFLDRKISEIKYIENPETE